MDFRESRPSPRPSPRRGEGENQFDVQIVVSDGLNAYAIADDAHLAPYLDTLQSILAVNRIRVAPGMLFLTNGRVRAGYQIGRLLYGGLPQADQHKAIVHLIGERPGSMHHTFSAYITAPRVSVWGGESRGVDHDITRVVSGIADTALDPKRAAAETAKLIAAITGRS